jgi:hypothetical protein
LSSYRAFTKARRQEFLEHIRAGMQRGAAADALDLSRILVREYILSNKPFERLVLDAEVDATEHVQEALYQAAVSGSVAAAKTWLELHGHTNPVAPRAHVPDLPPASSEPFADLDNVSAIDPRRRKKRS